MTMSSPVNICHELFNNLPTSTHYQNIGNWHDIDQHFLSSGNETEKKMNTEKSCD